VIYGFGRFWGKFFKISDTLRPDFLLSRITAAFPSHPPTTLPKFFTKMRERGWRIVESKGPVEAREGRATMRAGKLAQL
jgi:hypothetical protein